MNDETNNECVKKPFSFKKFLIKIIIFIFLLMLTGAFPPIIIIPLGWGGYILIRFGRRYRKRWIIILGGCFVSLSIAFLSIVVSFIIYYIDGNKLRDCKSNLQCIDRAIGEYKVAHDGQYPASLEVLTENNDLVKDYLKCPCDKTDSFSSYIYYQANSENPASAKEVLLLEKSGHHKGTIGGIVLVTGAVLIIKDVSDILSQLDNLAEGIDTQLIYTEHPISIETHGSLGWD